MSFRNTEAISENGKTGVLLVNTGTPDAPTPHAVRKYLAQFLMDKRIAPMNRVGWWFILHLFILPRRGRVSAEKYQCIWTDEGSPFKIAHDKLAYALNEFYATKNLDVPVAYAMSYGSPSIASAMKDLRCEGCTQLVVLPLYPQQAFSTTKSVEDHVVRAAARTGWADKFAFIDDYHCDPVYIRAIAASIQHAGFDAERGDRLLFSYHSIPLKDIEAGDVYELQTSSSSLHIASELELPRKQWTIAYQCRFDKGREWLSPSTKSVVDRWVENAAGARRAHAEEPRVFVVCPNFAIDCLETLFDIKRELKPYYLEEMANVGVHVSDDSFVYVPCLGKSRAHLKVLEHVLRPYIEGQGGEE